MTGITILDARIYAMFPTAYMLTPYVQNNSSVRVGLYLGAHARARMAGPPYARVYHREATGMLSSDARRSAQEFFTFLVKCGYHGNALAYPSYIVLMHIYTSISSIHASLNKFH